jgi:hypothetical protein
MLRIFEKYIRENKNGSVLTFVVLMTFILSILGVSLLGLGLNARMDAVRDSAQMSACTGADSGIAQAIHLMNKKVESEVVWDETDIPSAENVDLPNCNSNYSFKIAGDPTAGYAVESVGRSGTHEKTIIADLELKGLHEYAIFANSDIELKMGTTIDGYNYDVDDPLLQIGTNSIEPLSVGLKSFVTIEGDVVIGPDGDPEVVVENKLDAVVVGDYFNLPTTWKLPTVTVPESLITMPSSGTISGGEVITTSGRYENIHMTSTNQTVIINGDVTLYIVGETTVGNTCSIEIVDLATNPNASLTLYLGGNYTQKVDAHLVNNTNDPKRLKLFGLEGCTDISFLSDSSFYGTIYAPYAEMNLHNSVEIFGSVIVDYFVQHVSADFHYDASLIDVSINDIGVKFVVDRWRE